MTRCATGSLGGDLRRAVAGGEIEPFYEPIMDLKGELVGFEILARWRHRREEIIGPDVFLPITEKLGLVSEMTLRLLRRACLDAKHWPAGLSLSLNISPLLFEHAMLPMQVVGILSEAGFPPGQLEIEITERALAGNPVAARAILASFRNLGIKASLDDFGTGYASLYHLQELQFDKIKIDRSFVKSMQASPDSVRIVNAFLGLARNLDLPVVAEGIETTEALKRMIDGGCRFGQGYYFGRPLPAAEVPAMIGQLSGSAGARRA